MLYLGDCVEYMKTIKADSIDAVITSPPYYNARPEYSEWATYQDYLAFMDMVINSIFSILKPSGRIAINIPDGYSRNPWLPLYADICKILQSIGFELRGSIVWNKSNGAGKTSWGSWRSSSNPCLIDEHEMIIIAHKSIPNIENGTLIDKAYFLKLIHSVWTIKPETNSTHPAAYPEVLPQRLITLLTGDNSIIFDPFMGSGTTGIAAIHKGRNFIGCEIDPKYYAIAEKRIKQAAMQEPLFV